MLNISFLPESDREDFSNAIAEYTEIWKTDGERIVTTLEKYAGLSFQEKTINALVFESKFQNHSVPLILRAGLNRILKQTTLTHELGHRLLFRQMPGMKDRSRLDVHKLLYLILGDVFVELFGQEIFLYAQQRDEEVGGDYRAAWEWVKVMSLKERTECFAAIRNGDITRLDLTIQAL